MDKLNKLRYAVIAVGVLASLLFYVHERGEDGIIYTNDYAFVSGDDAIGSDFGTDLDPQTQAPVALTEERVEEIVSQAIEQAIENDVKAAVREEIIAAGEEGYLEEAVKNAESLAASEAEAKKGMVNINTADAEELMTLSGIGESRAQDIISYRESIGGFSSIEELKNVSGIADKSFEKIKDKIYV